MPNIINIQFSIFYSDPEANLIPEINKRIATQINVREDKAVIGKVLYGLQGEAATLGKDQLDVDYIYPILFPLSKSLLICRVENGIPYKLQDHIFKHIATIDPMAVVCMDYYDKQNSLIGSRMIIFNDEIETRSFESKFVINPNRISFVEAVRANQIETFENMYMAMPSIENYSDQIASDCGVLDYEEPPLPLTSVKKIYAS